jgi:prephenate dehydrogenase
VSDKRRVALIGTGMIGGSLLLALEQAGLVERAIGYDLAKERAERARARGIVHEVAADPAAAVAGADLVILAVPVRATREVCEQLAPALARAPTTLVTDVGSTKRDVLAAVEAALPHPERFVGGHPLAGTERSGPEAADAALFRGKRCLITPLARTHTEALATCRALWEAAGAQVSEIDPVTHDRVLAYVSHLPHAAAFALAAAVGREPQAVGLSGGGFADTTRIAASDPAMWRDVFLSNRDELLRALEVLDEELGALRRAIAHGDIAAIEALVLRAHEGRRRAIEGRPA